MNEKQNIDILDIMLMLSKHKKFIIITTVVVSIFAVVYSLLAVKYWTSYTSFYPSKEEALGMSSFNLSGFSASLLGGLQPESVEQLQVLKSNTINYKIIDIFNLVEYFEIKESNDLVRKEEALKKLKGKVASFSMNEETGLITVRITTKDRVFSAKIANKYVELLDKYNRNSKNNKGKDKKEFLEKRIFQIEDQIDSLQERIKDFNKNHNVINLEIQTQEAIAYYSELVAKRRSYQMKLELLHAYSDSKNTEIIQLNKRLSIIDSQIKNFRTQSEENKELLLISFDDIPDISMTYAKLKMEYNIAEKLYQYLYPEYESAKLQEIKDLSTIDVLDKAIPSGKRSKPRRAVLCIIAFSLALFLSSVYVILLEYLRYYFSLNKVKITSIKDSLFH